MRYTLLGKNKKIQGCNVQHREYSQCFIITLYYHLNNIDLLCCTLEINKFISQLLLLFKKQTNCAKECNNVSDTILCQQMTEYMGRLFFLPGVIHIIL